MVGVTQNNLLCQTPNTYVSMWLSRPCHGLGLYNAVLPFSRALILKRDRRCQVLAHFFRPATWWQSYSINHLPIDPNSPPKSGQGRGRMILSTVPPSVQRRSKLHCMSHGQSAFPFRPRSPCMIVEELPRSFVLFTPPGPLTRIVIISETGIIPTKRRDNLDPQHRHCKASLNSHTTERKIHALNWVMGAIQVSPSTCFVL